MFEPTRVELISEDLSACRACLATNTKLYSISDDLEDKFVELMGVAYSEDDGLPQHLCPYCRMQLLKFSDLRVRCHRSQELLEQALKIHPYLSTDNILSINRNFHNLSLNLVRLSVYTFNSHEKNVTDTDQTEDLNMEVSDGENHFDDIEKLTEVNTETTDPLIEAVDTQVISKEIAKVTEARKKQLKPKGPCIEIDGINGEIKIKNAEAEKGRMLKEYNKRLAEKENKKRRDKEQRISKLIRFVTGKKRNAPPLTKWQMQLRREENNYLPNFDHAEFERAHDCKLEILTTEEQLAEIEQRKRCSNYLVLDYKCETCGWGFEFEQSYKNHMAKHDERIGLGRFQCEICRIYYRTQFLKYRHLDTHKMKFTCNICSFVTRAKHLARNHYLMHTGKVYKCKHCDASFTKSTSYLGHVRINHPSKDAVCEICGHAFVGALGLQHHKSRVHQKPKLKFKCKPCGVLFKSSEARSKHKGERGRCECDANTRPCAECGEVFSGEESLRTHATQSHAPAQHHCEECRRTFVSQQSFDTHYQRIHLKLKWPAYGRTRDMSRELYRKLRERKRVTTQVVCEICGAKLVSNAALERHQQSRCKRDRNTKSYPCPYCDKTCATRQGLQIHTTLHTGEKPYKCSQCPLEFRQSGALKRHHKGVHLGIDTRVPCEYCDKLFSTPSTRKLHVNTVHLRMPHPVRRRRKALDD